MTRLLSLAALLLVLAVPASAQPTVGTYNFKTAVASNDTLTIANVDAGSAVLVGYHGTSSGNRQVSTVTDDGGNSYARVVAAPTCGVSGQCTELWIDYSVNASASLTVTLDQSSTFSGYSFFAIEISCGGTCQADASSLFSNASTTTHYASADGTVIDTASNVLVSSFCTTSAAAGTITAKASWTKYDETIGGASDHTAVLAQYRSTAGALTDERGEITGTTARLSECAIISVKSPAASGGQGLMLMGIGGIDGR